MKPLSLDLAAFLASYARSEPPAKPEAWDSVNRSRRLFVNVRRSKRRQFQWFEAFVFFLLILDVSTHGCLALADRPHPPYPVAQKCRHAKLRLRPPSTRAMWIALLPLMNPITCDTAYFGGTDVSMCT